MFDLVLASSSPRRAELLRRAGVHIEVRPVACDETPRRSEDAESYLSRIIRAKLHAACAASERPQLKLVADTVVWQATDRIPLGKPKDAAECAAMLDKLCGPDGHLVTTAWAVCRTMDDAQFRTCQTKVFMRQLDSSTRAAYLRGDDWRDKAGGYGIQSQAASWVTRIEGSYTNVVGLPVAQVLTELEENWPCARSKHA